MGAQTSLPTLLEELNAGVGAERHGATVLVREGVSHNISRSLSRPFYSSVEDDYWIALRSRGVTFRDFNFLSVRGTDALDFLHRLSTNEILKLQAQRCRTTVLTSEKARLIDVVTVIRREHDLLLVCSSNHGPSVREWLEKYVVMEDIEITDVSHEFSILSVIGVDAENGICRLTGEVEVSDEAVVSVPVGGGEGCVFKDPMWAIPVYNIVLPLAEVPDAWQRLIESLQPIGTEALEHLRVEQGIPVFGRELSDQVNPLEANMERFVSFTKGCYIGQEVIARLDTYKKLQKKLAGFVFDAPDIDHLPTGKLYVGDTEVGWTTSHSFSFRLQRWIALGYMNTHIVANEFDFIPSGHLTKILAKLSQLPF